VADLDLTIRGESRSVGGFRWVILTLIFLGTTINYVDRLVIALVARTIQQNYGITPAQYGTIGAAFAIAYACGQVFSGAMLDRIGTRAGYALSLFLWSICAMLTGLSRGFLSFAIFRACLGISESPAYPAAAKICAEWFPQRQRSYAFGWVNAGCNMAAIITPLVVPFLTLRFGWPSAFFWTGAMGLILLAVWLPIYKRPEEHPRVSRQELALILSDPPQPSTKLPWINVIQYRQTWVFMAGKMFTDGIWWFFVTWIPLFFLSAPYNMDLKNIGWPLVLIYLMANIGAVAGGMLSSVMIRRGASVNVARKTAMLVCGACTVPIIFAPHCYHVWTAALIVGIAVAGHQGYSSNLYTVVSDLFPKNLVASVSGLGGFCGYMGAALFQEFTGRWVDYTHNYNGPFFCAGIAYVASVAIMHALSPDFQATAMRSDGGRGFEPILKRELK
jgi:ACS family hexuronate transporter-like MFS transporter